ncbi:hypothetical protein NKJ36_04645 [Mesorhizobium sp. M0142]|uniref:hypothetical protein n=1 Tax=unclassified Mesorhizobium TaxID=325217 RepID=UPI0012EBAE28|nr:hypothetical protein [Mesorhizobium sp. LSHC420B00]
MDERACKTARFYSGLPVARSRFSTLPQSGTQRLTAAAQPVQKLPGSLWILGGKAVHNTTCCGEQTKKLCLSLIRRRFVPALSGTLTARAENTLEMIKAD